MNDRITLQELIELFAQKCQLGQADTALFVKEFFALIEEALARDKYVKVKGLGTFKLINIEARRSVDVNTGESIEIKEHTRVSFIPETGLRELINKPFAHFQSVLLNDEVHFDDILEEGSSTEGEEFEGVDAETVEETAEELREEYVVEEVKARETSQITEETAPSVEEAGKEANVDESKEQAVAKPEVERETGFPEKGNKIPWCMIASVLLTGVVIGGIVTWALTSGRRYVPEQVVEYLMDYKRQEIPPVVSDSTFSKMTDTLAVKKDSSQTQKILPQDTVKKKKEMMDNTPQTPAVVTPKKETLADTVEYQITGTQTSYTLRPGESLVRVALKFYGNKKLWPYLVKHNKSIIKNPDNVPVGTTIQIPQLTPKK